MSDPNRPKRRLVSASVDEAVVAASPCEKKAKRSGADSSRKQKRTTVPQNVLYESRERAAMAAAERDSHRFEKFLLSERLRMAEAEQDSLRSENSHLRQRLTLTSRKLDWHETVRDNVSNLSRAALLRCQGIPPWVILEARRIRE